MFAQVSGLGDWVATSSILVTACPTHVWGLGRLVMLRDGLGGVACRVKLGRSPGISLAWVPLGSWMGLLNWGLAICSFVYDEPLSWLWLGVPVAFSFGGAGG